MDSGVNRIFITIACSATVALAIGYWLKYRRTNESDVEIGTKVGDRIVDGVKEIFGYKSREKADDDDQSSGKVHGERVDNVYRNGSVESFVGNDEKIETSVGEKCGKTKSGGENGEMKCENGGAWRIRDEKRVEAMGEVKSSKKAPDNEGTEKISDDVSTKREKDVEKVLNRETVEEESENNEAAKKAHDDENIEKARHDENIERAHSDKNVEKARDGENIEKARGDGNIEKAHGDKNIEKARGGGNVEKARGDGNIEKAHGDKNIEKARGGGNVEKARDDGNIENARAGKDAEKARDDGNVEKAHRDGNTEKARSGENIEKARGDKNIEKARGDGSIEKARDDKNVEKALDNGVAKVRDEKSVENVVDADSVEKVLDDFQKVLDDGIVDSLIPEKEWVKIGNLKQLFIYPLKSGRGREIKEAAFTEYGLCVLRNGSFPLRDRMFLIYEEGTGEFRTGRNYPTLVLITLAAVTQSRAKLEAVGMPTLTFTVPKSGETDATPIPCSMWWGETLDCIDCGDTVARWISKFVTGTNTGLRLGCTTEKRRVITQGPWEKFTKVYTNLRNEDTGLYSDLASYMLMTEASVDKLNRKLQHPVPALQFRPNIVVSGSEPFQEDSWEWIKIGRDVVIRNVKPCPRFREQRDEDRVKVDGKAPTMGIYCGLYKAGQVKVGDEVYIRYATNESNPKSESDHFIKAEASTFGNGLS